MLLIIITIDAIIEEEPTDDNDGDNNDNSNEVELQGEGEAIKEGGIVWYNKYRLCLESR